MSDDLLKKIITLLKIIALFLFQLDISFPKSLTRICIVSLLSERFESETPALLRVPILSFLIAYICYCYLHDIFKIIEPVDLLTNFVPPIDLDIK